MSVVIAITTLFLFSQMPATGQQISGGYIQHNLVSNLPNTAITTDPDLKNAWGIAFAPTGPFWISDAGTGVSTLYNGTANKLPLTVTIPPPETVCAASDKGCLARVSRSLAPQQVSCARYRRLCYRKSVSSCCRKVVFA